MQKVSSLIKTARRRKGITQLELSERLGLQSGQFVSNLERGLVSLPMKHALRVSKLLNVSVDAIIEAKTADQKDLFRRKAKRGAQTRVSGL